MNKINVYTLPLAANICDQLLREIDQTPTWSVAHVLMNPRASSLLHKHCRMDETYLITRGAGRLVYGDSVFLVRPGDAVRIPLCTRHQLTNIGSGTLEHFVLAAPPFNPNDVYLVNEADHRPATQPKLLIQPPLEDALDGAKIVAYQFGNLVSVAFGWVIEGPPLKKLAHYHEKTTEWIFVVEGSGAVEINESIYPIACGDWVRVDAGEHHALRNTGSQPLVVVCICSPPFRMDDVYYQ